MDIKPSLRVSLTGRQNLPTHLILTHSLQVAGHQHRLPEAGVLCHELASRHIIFSEENIFSAISDLVMIS